MAKKATEELEKLRRAEGGAIGKHDWEVYVAKSSSSLAPMVRMHKTLMAKTLGIRFWEKAQRERMNRFGTLAWPVISKNMRAQELHSDDKDLDKHEHTFDELVRDAFHHHEKRNAVMALDYEKALQFAGKNLKRKVGERGDEHPVYVDARRPSGKRGFWFWRRRDPSHNPRPRRRRDPSCARQPVLSPTSLVSVDG